MAGEMGNGWFRDHAIMLEALFWASFGIKTFLLLVRALILSNCIHVVYGGQTTWNPCGIIFTLFWGLRRQAKYGREPSFCWPPCWIPKSSCTAQLDFCARRNLIKHFRATPGSISNQPRGSPGTPFGTHFNEMLE